MKTKSKRFLNLATLCLALLGTTLLMAHPVKAEVVPTAQEVQQTTEHEDNISEDIIKKEYMALFGFDDNDLEDHLQDPGSKEYYKGYVDGYKKGFKGEERTNRGDIEAPDIEDEYEDEYKDGHEGGFEAGRRKAYPVTAFLEEVWGFLTGIFSSWFSGEEGSQ
ncbi:TPA: hypothetical protein ACQM9F_000427 [Streptococcus pyogenes]|uniref:hypothetical protein n=1 Tax=Streptococcus pyogenes TaxID=1314 RepID=UPI0010A11C28|nr:hypothetical protein [Streptococcus pyogenes]VHA17760.1 Uncharacterised protein [Streptococcus pyogenes]HEQ8384490.1 hypothetical protein [Streptococcus pyogenes]